MTRQETLTLGIGLVILGHVNYEDFFVPIALFQWALGIGFVLAWLVRQWREDR